MNPDQQNPQNPIPAPPQPPLDVPQPPIPPTPTPVFSQPPIPSVPSPLANGLQVDNSKSKLIAIVAITIVVLAGVGVAASVLLKSDKDDRSSTTKQSTTKSSSSTLEDTDKPDVTTEQTAPATTAVTTLSGKTISDPEMGYTLTAKTLDTKSFSLPAKYAETQKGNTPVAIEFELKDTNKFYGSAKYANLTLITADGRTVAPATSLYADQLKAKNLVSVDNAKEVNDVVSGWNIYHVPTDKLGKLTLRYKRQAVKVIGSDQTIPPKEFEIPLL